MLPQFPEAHANDFVVANARAQALSDKWITPHMGSITAGLRKLRAGVDRHFEAKKTSSEGGKPAFLSDMKDIHKFPYGHCDIIRNLVWDNIQVSLKRRGAAGHHFSSLRPFLEQGGVFRKIWGELTYGPYFQSAMQLGAYYIDVANDTVVVTKPKLEIKPLADTELCNVDDFVHYFRVASAYFNWDVYPNIYLPEFAALYPAVAVHRDTGALVLCGVAKPLFFKNLNSGGALAQRFLDRSDWSDRRLSPEQEARLADFRVSVLPQVLAEARAAGPALDRDLAVIASPAALRAWLQDGHPLDHYRQAAARIEALVSRAGAHLRPFSLQAAA